MLCRNDRLLAMTDFLDTQKLLKTKKKGSLKNLFFNTHLKEKSFKL